MKKLIINIAKVIITVTILILIFWKFRIAVADILASFRHKPIWFTASFFMQVCAIFFSILRWQILLNGQGLNVPFAHVVQTFLVGRFLGTFTPTGIGLEAYKAYDIARYTGKMEASVSVVFIEKMVGSLFSLCFLVLITLPFYTGLIKFKFLLIFGGFFTALLILALILMFFPDIFRFFQHISIPFKSKFEKSLNRFIDSFVVYKHSKGRLLSAIALGWAVYIFWFLTYYTNNLALGAGISLIDIMKVGPMTQIATMIPLSIAGIGLREGAFIALLNVLGLVQKASSEAKSAMLLSATMVYFVSVSVNIAGAIIFLVRRTDYKKQMEEIREIKAAVQ